MDSPEIHAWQMDMNREVATLRQIDPHSTAVVSPPLTAGDTPPPTLERLYRYCGSLTLAGLWNGYFIDSAARAATASERGEPSKILFLGGQMHDVQVFGSDGGGGRFVVGAADPKVFYLPSDGAVRDGVYLEEKGIRAVELTADIDQFMARLLEDLRAFVRSDVSHRYLTDVPPSPPSTWFTN